MTRPDKRLERASRNLDVLARMKPAADQHIANGLSQCDTQQVNETGISSNTLSNPVLSAVMAREHWVGHSNGIDEEVAVIESAIRRLNEKLKAVGVPRVLVEHPTCTGGDPSTWGDPECSRHVRSYRRSDGSIGYASNGLCDMHDRARLRWEASTREGAA